MATARPVKTNPHDVRAAQALELAQSLHPLLAGYHPEVISGCLAELVAAWLSGHLMIGDPMATRQLRQQLLRGHADLVRKLLPSLDEHLQKMIKKHAH